MTSSDAGEVKPVELKMTAVGSGREVDLASLLQPVLFVAFGQETQAGSDPVEQVARARYKPSDLLVVSLIDLHKIPSLIRKMAEGVLNNEHKKAVEALPAGADPYEYVVVLPDWKGEGVKSLGLTDATKAIGLALVDTAGRVQWRYQGAEPAPALEARFASNPL